LAPVFFGGEKPPKFWTTLTSTVHNFAAMGRRSSEISRGNKKEMPAKHKPAPKAIASGRTNERKQDMADVADAADATAKRKTIEAVVASCSYATCVTSVALDKNFALSLIRKDGDVLILKLTWKCMVTNLKLRPVLQYS